MRYRKWAGLLALVALAFGLGRGSAQSLLPDGVFVRDSGGGVWLIAGGQRAQVPFYPAGDDVIFAVPDSGLWVVPGEGGVLTLGGQPEFVNAPPVMMPAPPTPTATPIPDDPAPAVSIQVDDDRVRAGQTVSITVIAEDNESIRWIEWEGTVIDEDDNSNDNRPTGDPALDGRHRHDCDGRAQCAFVWQVTPSVGGQYVLRARAQDEAGNRSEWTSIDFRVTGSLPTPTPRASTTDGGAANPTPTQTP